MTRDAAEILAEERTKACSQCREVKPLGEFNKHRSNPDGRQYQCQLCRHQRRRAAREAQGPPKYDGRSKHALYGIWTGIMQRCCNPGSHAYKYYGARGISVHAEWTSADGFWMFAAYIEGVLGARPEAFSLDRIDVNRGYEPGNLRWADKFTQMNNRRNNVRVEIGERYGRLVVLELTRMPKAGARVPTPAARCRCDCGREIVTRVENLPAGRARSCGCRQRDAARATMGAVNARRRVRAAAGLSSAPAPALTKSRGAGADGQLYLTIAGVAALLDVDPQTVRSYRVRSKPGGIYARDPFPAPDDTIGRNPVWHPDRAEGIRSWSKARVGRGNGGGRPPDPRTAEDMAQKEARAKGATLQVCGVLAGRQKSIDTYATFVDPDALPGR